MKELATDLDVPVVATMMGCRTYSSGLEDGRHAVAPPSVTVEFRDCPDVLSSADSVWLLHRPSACRNHVDVRFIHQSPEYNAELMLARNYGGVPCIIPMAFDSGRLMFAEAGSSVLPYSEEENVRLYELIRPSQSLGHDEKAIFSL